MSKKNRVTPEIRQSVFSLMEKYARPGIDFKLSLHRQPLPTGSTKIGGTPDLPPGFEWPTYTDPEDGTTRPLSFLAQVNLADAAAHDARHELPPTGWLLFFYDMQSYRTGLSTDDVGSFRCFYVEGGISLEPGHFPVLHRIRGRNIPVGMSQKADLKEQIEDFPEDLDEDYRFVQRAVKMIPAQMPPMADFLGDEAVAELAALMGDEEEGLELYRKLRPRYRGYKTCYEGVDECGTFLLGSPDVLQNPMEELCAHIVRALELGLLAADDELPEAELAALPEAAREWVLLFQLASVEDDAEDEFMFGDMGNLYFWIRREDLANRRFDKVWMMWQC